MRDPGGTGRYGAVGLCFIFCAACAGPLVRSAQPALEVTNGGFEEIQDGPTYQEVLVAGQWTQEAVTGPQPRGWRTRIFAGDVQCGLDAQVRHSGRYAATLTSLSAQESASATLHQPMEPNLQQGQDYTVTFWVKKTPLARTGIGVWSDAGSHFESQAYWDFQADFSQWQKIRFCFQAQRTTTQGFWIMLSLEGVVGDQVWFDEVSCQPGRPEPEGPETPGGPGKLPDTVRSRGYGFFHMENFAEIRPSFQPGSVSASGSVTLAACPGEFAAGSVGIYAVRPLPGLRITSGDLRGSAGTIPAAEMDVRVVQCWRQKRPLWTSQPPPPVVLPDDLAPELLLKDDRWNDNHRPRGFSPEIPLTGPVVTDLPAETAKQVWITAHVPDTAPSGPYRGSLTFAAAEGRPSTVDLTLNVLPFRLVEAPEILGAYVNTGYGFGRDPQSDPDSRYEKTLQDLRDHGLNSVGLLDGVGREEVQGEWVLRWDHLRKALQYRQEYGLDRFNMFEGFIWATEGMNPLYQGQFDPETQALLQWYVRALNQAVREAGLRPLTYYLIDEPHVHANGIQDSQRLGQLVQEAGGQTCAAVTLAAYQSIGPAIDIPILGVGLDTRRYLQALRDGQTAPPAHPLLCYWQFWEEHPLLNRFMFGYFLWASGLDGAIPYGYQHFGGAGDPYDDFDTEGKDMFVAYPSQNGPVATMQWEACREGIQDLRYLHTLEQALDRASKNLAAPKEGTEAPALREKIRRGESFLRDLRERIQIVPRVPVKPPLEAPDYARLRRTVIRHILTLEGKR